MGNRAAPVCRRATVRDLPCGGPFIREPSERPYGVGAASGDDSGGISSLTHRRAESAPRGPEPAQR